MKNGLLYLYVIIISRTSFRVNLHTMVCLNVKELLAQNRRHIWSLSYSNGIRTHNHLIRKRTHNHLTILAKWSSVHLRTKWLWVRIPLRSALFQICKGCKNFTHIFEYNLVECFKLFVFYQKISVNKLIFSKF